MKFHIYRLIFHVSHFVALAAYAWRLCVDHWLLFVRHKYCNNDRTSNEIIHYSSPIAVVSYPFVDGQTTAEPVSGMPHQNLYLHPTLHLHISRSLIFSVCLSWVKVSSLYAHHWTISRVCAADGTHGVHILSTSTGAVVHVTCSYLAQETDVITPKPAHLAPMITVSSIRARRDMLCTSDIEIYEYSIASRRLTE